MSENKFIHIAGFPVVKTTSSVLSRYLLRTKCLNKKACLFFANTNFIVQCHPLLEKIKSTPVVIVNDGVGMDIAAYLFRRQAFKENLNGTDFVPRFFANAAAPLRVFMLGGRPEMLAKAAVHVRTTLKQEVVGTCDGYAGMAQDRAVLIDSINRARPDVVLVALGNPIQEEWILACRDALNANVVISVGALFDFWSGEKPRAPRLVRRIHLEWLFRLSLEPRRLAQRYTVDIMKFLLLCHRYSAENAQPQTRT
ncbi:exopolysaccharide biosynthesis protein, WecB/TagA/CpsF family [Herbaspirillum sp. CF444]|uniref:WecB/TagA/CpsF family glycosyltransferase n=1 Tax=Herbaspirillum sp. CF444 TaxID=1144319 RepID=UPI0002727EF4|nr:WecB/TagA/CpsF family glycosyltransferase [Herbaspirillum sp. CF444]EJL84271.1 exopolysaccharide biosynthesis protein, WecB/TagA/CpsF family [Herbaspirillum sp. CF444]